MTAEEWQEVNALRADLTRLRAVLDEVQRKADAWEWINKRGEEAHIYCHKYLMPDAWGRLVWHAILDDAIRLRAERKEQE